MNRTKLLGAYILIAGILQTVLYLFLSLSRDHNWINYFAVYLDPRIGIFFLEATWKGTEQIIPGVERWFTAGWLLTLGGLLLTGRKLVWFYIISEIALSLPTFFFFVVMILANLSSAHGFSVGELFVPILVMMAFSIIPLVLAFWSRKHPARLDSRNPVLA